MSAYVILDIEVVDPERYDEYKKLAAPTIEAFDGKYLVRGGHTETLEGEWVARRVVVLEFPTPTRAKEWWASEQYRAARELRMRCARTDTILVEGT